MNKLLENDFILLRALEPEDLDILYKWENDTQLWEYGSSIKPFSRFALRQYIIDAQQDIYQSKQLRLMIICKADNTYLGTIDLYDFDAFNSRIGIGILIDPQHRQKGYGLQAVNLLQEYVFGFLNLHQIYSFISVKNKVSIKLFEKADFCHAATLKEWVSIGNQFYDVMIMQKIKV